MITKEQVADLKPGDVVKLESSRHPGVVTTGPLRDDMGRLFLGPNLVRCDDGSPTGARDMLTLTVVSRAPRPLYVNHDRTEPAFGDTARKDFDDSGRVYWRDVEHWRCNDGGRYDDHQMPARLRLLVDGETGQVVP